MLVAIFFAARIMAKVTGIRDDNINVEGEDEQQAAGAVESID